MALSACSEVRFIDPDAALKEGLRITTAHRFLVEGDPRTYFHVRIGTRQGIDLISLSVSNVTGVQKLALEDAHIQRCGDVETCISLSLPPGAPEDVERIALEAPSIGHRHEQGVNIVRLRGYRLFGDSIDDNQNVFVTIEDPIRAFLGGTEVAREYDDNGELVSEMVIDLFPRTFEASVTSGSCGVPAGPEDSGWTPARGNPFAMPAAFPETPDPETCASVRPTLPRGGAGVAALTIRARAVLVRFSHVYVPPSETSPLVAIPLFDLEIPDEGRCAAAQELVRAAVLDAATEIASREEEAAEVLILDSVQLATKDGFLCRQAEDRTFNALNVATDIRAQIDARFGTETRARVVLIYASNLNLGLPISLVIALQQLRAEIDTFAPARRSMTVSIAPERPSSQVGAEQAMPWLASEEPAFRSAIKQLLQNIWPFKTMLHNNATIVPLVEAPERERFAAFRICLASELVHPVGTQHPETDVFYTGSEGPSYRVDLIEQVLVESSSFVVPAVMVDWEGCVKLCDHPPPGGDSVTPWERSFACL